MLFGKKIVLGVTGGIAAYKACEIVSRLKKQGAEVRVVMTENATKLVAPLTFETLSGNFVYTDTFERAYEIGHISLAKWADLFLVAPATANFIGKMAAGIADDILTTTAMAMPCPVAIAPAMNAVMWRSAANQANIDTLKNRGTRVIGPEAGLLACGDDDIGRMTEPDDIVKNIAEWIGKRRDLEGKRILVTAGPTREDIDPVRFLSNRSTGKMGYAIAEAARDRGASVTLVTGPVSLAKPQGIECVSILTTLELYDVMMERAPMNDAVIQAAAPADFRPARVSDQKIKKTGGEMSVDLVPNPDVALELGRRKTPGQVLVCFAAETNDVLAHARQKLVKKNADLLVANDVTQPGAGFGVDTNVITLIDAESTESIPMLTKREAADRILDRIASIWGEAT